jgi:hypothetical protein
MPKTLDTQHSCSPAGGRGSTFFSGFTGGAGAMENYFSDTIGYPFRQAAVCLGANGDEKRP